MERLRSWRSEQAKKQQVPAYVVLHNSHLEEISIRKPSTIHELGAIKGVGLRRAARYGNWIDKYFPKALPTQYETDQKVDLILDVIEDRADEFADPGDPPDSRARVEE